MKVVAHISDLHFGAHLPRVTEALLRDLRGGAPDLIVVSGDFTQRARRSQFAAARAFLAQLPAPFLTIPGNHDIPLYDVARRFLSPLGRYHRYISGDENPVYEDEELFVIGLNTARSLTWKSGRISRDQILLLDERLARAGTRLKVIVTHHPFIPPPDGVGIDLVGRAALALPILVAHKVDLLLSGHLHHGYIGDTRAHYPESERGVIAVQAGTAISHRVRGEPNAYNRLVLARDRMEIETRIYRDTYFHAHSSARFERRDHVWLRGETQAS